MWQRFGWLQTSLGKMAGQEGTAKTPSWDPPGPGPHGHKKIHQNNLNSLLIALKKKTWEFGTKLIWFTSNGQVPSSLVIYQRLRALCVGGFRIPTNHLVQAPQNRLRIHRRMRRFRMKKKLVIKHPATAWLWQRGFSSCGSLR